MKTFLLFLFISAPALAQVQNPIVFPGVPSGACGPPNTAVNQATGDFYSCNGGTWLRVGPGAGGGGNIAPGINLSQFPSWSPSGVAWQPQNKAIYDTRDWMTCDGATDTTAGLTALLNVIGTQNATIRAIGTTTPTASCVVKFAHFGPNVTIDTSGGGSFSLLNVGTAPGGGAFVQGGGQSNNPSSSTCSFTLATPVTAGNFIVAMVSLYNTFGNSRISSVTDNNGNFYNQQQATTIGQAGYEALYVAPSIVSGSTTITANFSGTATKNACMFWEVSGLGPVPKLDAGTFSYGSTTPFNSGAATLAAGDFVVGYSEDPNDAQTCTAAGGFTQPASTAGNVSSAGPSMCSQYIANGAGGSTTSTQNFSSSPVASSYVSAIAGLKPGIATLIIQGGIVNPDNHQIFYNATGSTGLVDLTGNTAPIEVRPEWWGASGQPGANVTTNAAALQAAEQAAWGCGLATCRVNGSGLNIYNKVLRLSSNYSTNAELKMYHVIGAGGAARAKIYCDGGGGITQTATNLRIIDGQSVAYFESHGCIWTGNASSTNALIDWDFSGGQGADLAPQFIDHYGETFVGNSQVDVGVLIAKSGGGAQGSNIYCHDCESSGFTGAAWQIGGDNTGRNVGRLGATNALAIGYDGDIQGSPLYGIAVYGGGYVSFGGGSRLSTMENGFTTQTGFDMFCSITQGPCVMEHYRSESRKIIFCNTCQLKDVFAINQSSKVTPGSSSPIGAIFSGSQVGGDGAYYKVTIDAAGGIPFGGVGTTAAPIRASGGSTTTVVNTNQTLTGSVTVKTFPGASLNETMTQAVSGATGIRLNSPANNATITGTASGSQIVLNETMTQATTGVTCTEQAPTPVTGTSSSLICNNFSGTADSSHAWTGGSSGGVYTPSAGPSFGAASPVLVIGTVTGSPDSTHIWTGGTSGGVYTPTQAPQPAGYTVNAFAGMIASIMTGTSALCYGTVSSNTSTTITVGAWITRYPQVPCPGPDSTSTFIVEPGWNHGTVVSGGMTLVYMNENVIDGPNGAGGTFEDVIGYGGQWNMASSPTQRNTLRHVQVSRQDWYSGASNTPQYKLLSSGLGTITDGDWDVLVFPPGADRPQNWSSLLLGSGATAYSGATHNTVVKPFCWNASTETQSANELCIGGRSDPSSGTSTSRNILEFTGMLGRSSPVPNAANNYNITDQNGTPTQIIGGLPTGAGTPGNIEFWEAPGGGGSSATPQTGAAVVTITPTGISTTGQFTSTKATGTAPLVITSTTPVANLTTVPTTYDHSGNQQTAAHLVQDSCVLGTSCSVTLTGASVYTSSTSYTCVCEDSTAIAACKVAQSSGSAFVITGTGTDAIRYACIGN